MVVCLPVAFLSTWWLLQEAFRANKIMHLQLTSYSRRVLWEKFAEFIAEKPNKASSKLKVCLLEKGVFALDVQESISMTLKLLEPHWVNFKGWFHRIDDRKVLLYYWAVIWRILFTTPNLSHEINLSICMSYIWIFLNLTKVGHILRVTVVS